MPLHRRIVDIVQFWPHHVGCTGDDLEQHRLLLRVVPIPRPFDIEERVTVLSKSAYRSHRWRGGRPNGQLRQLHGTCRLLRHVYEILSFSSYGPRSSSPVAWMDVCVVQMFFVRWMPSIVRLRRVRRRTTTESSRVRSGPSSYTSQSSICMLRSSRFSTWKMAPSRTF